VEISGRGGYSRGEASGWIGNAKAESSDLQNKRIFCVCRFVGEKKHKEEKEEKKVYLHHLSQTMSLPHHPFPFDRRCYEGNQLAI